ncbi:MAG: hypothetical protein ABSH20_03170, partial [Tepidisphaeraceae bacterium]
MRKPGLAVVIVLIGLSGAALAAGTSVVEEKSDFLISSEIELALTSAEIMPFRKSFWPESADAGIGPRSVP